MVWLRVAGQPAPRMSCNQRMTRAFVEGLAVIHALLDRLVLDLVAGCSRVRAVVGLV
jgi:hypothetical protein